MDRIVLSIPAKINIVLRILTHRVGGYHQIESLFQSVDLRDAVTIVRGGEGISLETEGIVTPEGESNLAHRAAAAYLEAAGLDDGLSISLTKNIPVGAGLGGGSADAAAVLLGLNILFDERLDSANIVALARELGSDVPFMLKGGTALGWARGDRIIRLSPLPAWPVILCIPEFPSDTREAYDLIDASTIPETAGGAVYEPADFYSLDMLKSIACNDFEQVIFERHPELQELKDTLLQLGGEVVQLTGSGSALFALFSRERERAGCLKVIRERFPHQVVSTRCSSDGLQVEELD